MVRGEANNSGASTSGRRVKCPLPSWVTNFSEALDRIVAQNTPMRARKGDGNSIYLSGWHTLTDPSIPMQSYVERLWRYSGCSSAAAFGSLVYMDRLSAVEDSFTPTVFNIHRLLTVTLVLAMKFFQEEVYPQDYLALVGGMTGAELNLLELEVLTRLNFNAFVHEEQLQRSIDLIRANLTGGRARAFPSARDLLDALWEEDLEVTDEPPSTPPGPSVTSKACNLAATRRFSDSMLVVQGGEASGDEEEDEDAVGELDGRHGHGYPHAHHQGGRLKASVSEGCFGHRVPGPESSFAGDDDSAFHSLDEELLTVEGFNAREALGALLCDEVFEEQAMADPFETVYAAPQAGRLQAHA